MAHPPVFRFALWLAPLLVLAPVPDGAGSSALFAADKADTEKTGPSSKLTRRLSQPRRQGQGRVSITSSTASPGGPAALLPGQLADSPLWQRIQQGEMPPPGKRKPVSPEEQAVLKRWIEAGAEATASGPVVAALSPAQVNALVLADLENQEPRQRRFLRYPLLRPPGSGAAAGRGDPAAPPGPEQTGQQPLLACPHHQTSTPRRRRYGLRVDLREYRGVPEWDAGRVYPYRLKEQRRPKTGRVAGGARPLMHGDWFVATASRPPFYHDFLALPNTDRALERLLQVEWANLQDDNAVRAGFNGSGVPQQPRHRAPRRRGDYRRSYDFSDNGSAKYL